MPPANTARFFVRALSSIAVLALFGCGGDEVASVPSTTEPPTTTTTETPNTATTTPEDAVRSDLQASLDAYTAARAVSDPDHPELLATMTGSDLAATQRRLADYRDLGAVSTGTSTIESADVRINGSVATIDACLLETTVDHDAGTEPPPAPPAQWFKYVLELVQEDGFWKSSKTEYLGPGCDD